MALPTSGINVSMVRNELGESSNSITTLCKSDKINKWSKWKPQNVSEPLTQSNIDANKWGIEVNEYTSISSLYDAISGNYDAYHYTRPTACRLGDFRNYHHNVVLPLGTGKAAGTTTTIEKGADGSTTNFMMLQSISTDYKIGGDDIKAMFGYDELFICAGVKIGTSFYFTSSDNITTIFWHSNNDLKNYVGNAYIFICWCTVNYNNEIRTTVQNVAERFIPIPSDANNCNPYMVALNNNKPVVPEKYYIVINSIYDYPNDDYVDVSFTLKADKEGYTGGNITNCYVKIYNGKPTSSSQAIATSPSYNGEVTSLMHFPVWEMISYLGTYTNDKWYRIYEGGEIIAEGMCMSELVTTP